MDVLRKIIRKKQLLQRQACAAVIVAAGSASRMNGVDKMMADLCGEPVLLRTLRQFEQCAFIDEIVVVTREDLLVKVSSLCQVHDLKKVRHIVLGGSERIHSVAAGLDSVSEDVRLAAIHDGARPLVTAEIIEKAIRRARDTGAAAPAIPVKDTIKIAEKHVITSTPDRSTLFAVQTPQVFDIDLIRGALQKAIQDGASVTDDCSAVEQLGMKVHLTEGSEENIKITSLIDLTLARAVFQRREST